MINIVFSACTTILSSKELDMMIKIRTLLVLLFYYPSSSKT